MSEKELIDWFEQNKTKINEDKNFWARNPIGKLLKTKLKELGYWKNKSKGRKANLESLEKARAIKRQLEEKENQLKNAPKVLYDF